MASISPGLGTKAKSAESVGGRGVSRSVTWAQEGENTKGLKNPKFSLLDSSGFALRMHCLLNTVFKSLFTTCNFSKL